MKLKSKLSMGCYIMLMFLLCIMLRMFLEGFYDGFMGIEVREQFHEAFLGGWRNVVKDILLDAGTAGVFAYLVYKKISMPFKNLTQNLDRITAGDLGTRISMDSPKEAYQIGTAFNAMADNLQKAQADRMKMEENNRLLYANIAHDLKSPMTMILGYARVLQQEKLSEEKKKEYLETICAQSVHMNELLDVLLSYTKLQNSAYQLLLEKKDVAELLRKCIAQYYLLFEEHESEIEIDIPEEKYLCMVDEAEWNRAVRNLISNMIVHTEKGTSCRISLQEISGERGSRVQLYFADRGGPLPDSVKENLFKPFCVGDESRNTKGGNGLGLSIVKKIVELHGGSVYYMEHWENSMKAFVVELELYR